MTIKYQSHFLVAILDELVEQQIPIVDMLVRIGNNLFKLIQDLSAELFYSFFLYDLELLLIIFVHVSPLVPNVASAKLAEVEAMRTIAGTVFISALVSPLPRQLDYIY